MLDAINNGDCKFVKLSPLEVKRHCEELQKKQDDGIVPVKTCKPRKDHGTKRPCTKGKKTTVNNAEDDDDEGAMMTKRSIPASVKLPRVQRLSPRMTDCLFQTFLCRYVSPLNNNTYCFEIEFCIRDI